MQSCKRSACIGENTLNGTKKHSKHLLENGLHLLTSSPHEDVCVHPSSPCSQLLPEGHENYKDKPWIEEKIEEKISIRNKNCFMWMVAEFSSLSDCSTDYMCAKHISCISVMAWEICGVVAADFWNEQFSVYVKTIAATNSTHT